MPNPHSLNPRKAERKRQRGSGQVLLASCGRLMEVLLLMLFASERSFFSNARVNQYPNIFMSPYPNIFLIISPLSLSFSLELKLKEGERNTHGNSNTPIPVCFYLSRILSYRLSNPRYPSKPWSAYIDKVIITLISIQYMHVYIVVIIIP